MQLDKLISKTDSYDPLPHEEDLLECRYEIFKGVWEEASDLRSSGKLLELEGKIRCPVTVILGIMTLILLRELESLFLGS